MTARCLVACLNMSYSRESVIFMLNDRSVACSYQAMGCTWEVSTHKRSARESQEAIAVCTSDRLKETYSLCLT